MKIKMLCRWIGVVGASVLLASASASQDVPASRYAVLADSDGVSTLALREAIDPQFETGGEPAVGETRAVIVMRGGAVIAERYAPGYGPHSRLLSWSIAKTVTGLLAGILVSDGRLALDDPAPVPAWHQTGDPRGAITLGELLHMRSGLQNREAWGASGRSDFVDMLVGEGARDQAAFAASKPLVHRPGESFAYSTSTSMIISGIITDQIAGGSRDPRVRHEAMARFLKARFSGPLGLTAFTPEYDESGTINGGAIMHMTARDYAKVGELIRLRGRANGHQILSDKWFDFMLAPSPAHSAYAGHIWLNRAGSEGALFPGQASPDIVAAVGMRGQFVLVSPRQGLTIVRLGNTSDADMPALREAMARLVRRFPG